MTQSTENRPSGADSALAVGVTLFAGIMMLINGILMVFYGITGIAKDNLFVLTSDYAFKFNTTTWGWIHLVIGLLVAAAGLGVLSGQAWARSLGIGITAIAALGNFMSLPYYPLWSLILLAIDILIIWGLASASD